MLRKRSVTTAVRSAASVALAPLAVAIAGCGATVTAFEPVQASNHAAATYPVKAYELRIGRSVLGDALVWSEGATEVSPSDRVLDLEMVIHNRTQTPIELDVKGARVSVTTRDGRTWSLGSPQRVGGSRTTAPGSSGRVGLHYALPAGLRPADVKGFAFNWRVASLVGDYAQSTAFVALEPQSSDAFVDRGLPCGGVYRISDVHECVGTPPLLAR